MLRRNIFNQQLRSSHKGTVRVISRDPQCKDGNARFTTIPLKPFLINNGKEFVVLIDLTVFNSDNSDMSY